MITLNFIFFSPKLIHKQARCCCLPHFHFFFVISFPLIYNCFRYFTLVDYNIFSSFSFFSILFFFFCRLISEPPITYFFVHVASGLNYFSFALFHLHCSFWHYNSFFVNFILFFIPFFLTFIFSLHSAFFSFLFIHFVHLGSSIYVVF